MKKFIIIALALVAGSAALSAQDTQKAAAEAAAALTAATDVPVAAPKPVYWTNTVLNQINFGQTSLWNWAAGGYNNYTLAAAIDANANYKKDKMIWNNRLQLDYGFLYSADKPILQKTKDRIYFESKWGYETPVRHLSYSAFFDFKTQFNDNWKYGTPKNTEGHEPSIQDWLDARTLMSDLLSPAYINFGVGILWTPKPWFSLNFSPVAADFVVVHNPLLRNTYGMELRDQTLDPKDGNNFKPLRFGLGAQLKADAKWIVNDNWKYGTPKNTEGHEPSIDDWLNARTLMSDFLSPAYINFGLGVLWTPKPWFSLNFSPLAADVVIVQNEKLRDTYGMELLEDGKGYKPVRFGLGAQLKADAKWVINDDFSYTTQLVLFSNYLHKPQNLRVNWDNKLFWKLAKYFAFTVSTNLIYDENVKVKEISDGTKVAAVQFKEFLEFGFTYTIAKKQ